MAESPAHRFGQEVGKLLEELILPRLTEFCDERVLYLDRHGNRVGVRKGKKVAWVDRFGNSHDLDFVVEKGGTATKQGRPVAFIEAAWRRYTKHSRAKAQEIQGAVLPIVEGCGPDKPFLGAILAGVFTGDSLKQLRSVGFEVLYIQYDDVMEAFASVGIDARFDEATPDRLFSQAVQLIEGLSASRRVDVKEHLYKANKLQFEGLFSELQQKLDRLIKRVLIVALFGERYEFTSVADARSFVNTFDEISGSGAFDRYEVDVKFSNGDRATANFKEKVEVHRFLDYIAS